MRGRASQLAGAVPSGASVPGGQVRTRGVVAGAGAVTVTVEVEAMTVVSVGDAVYSLVTSICAPGWP